MNDDRGPLEAPVVISQILRSLQSEKYLRCDVPSQYRMRLMQLSGQFWQSASPS